MHSLVKKQVRELTDRGILRAIGDMQSSPHC